MISKKTMEQYEQVRQSGVTNMYDYYGVITAANRRKFYALASLTGEEYSKLLSNFGKLMKQYDIKQLKSGDKNDK